MEPPFVPEYVNVVAVSFIVSAGILALLASRILSVLVGLPAREWRRWCSLRSRRVAEASALPLRHDLETPVAQLAGMTRALLDELSHARARVSGWNDGERPGLLARCLGTRNDDDYQPTIELFGEISRWLQQASAVVERDGPEVPQVRHASATIQGLVLDDGELSTRVDGIIAAIRELDARFSATSASPYRDRCPLGAGTAAPTTTEDDDTSARIRVLARHERVFRKVAARYADDESAREDLRQEIRLAVWLALPKHRGDASVSTYIRRIAHYCGARFGRKQLAHEPIDEPLDDGPCPVELLDAAERREALQGALSTLPRRQREAIELLLSGMTYREIADRLGITETNASVRISRARKQLRKRLAPTFA